MDNLYSIPDPKTVQEGKEVFIPLLQNNRGLLVERIISHGHITPENTWYDQDRDEWVAVLEGEARIRYENGEEILLTRGSQLLLPKHVKHRVVYTSIPCIWLAIHADQLAI